MIGSTLSAYRIVDTLGTGGMGTVYRAEVDDKAAGLEPGTAVALKVIHSHLLETPGFFKRFLREAQVGQQVQHENVVRTHDCDATVHDGQHHHFLVMEYVEGQTLRDLLNELERVPEELCRHIAHEVAQGLAAIHAAGVVHRDIKPENVLITEAQDIKVMDLGVAHLQEEVIRLSQTGMFVGSVEYAAPEQFMSGGDEADARADLHSLGVMLYELATGQHPYRDEDMHKMLRKVLDEEPRRAGAVNPQISAFFEEVIHTLMAKSKDDRFATAATLVAILEEGEESEWWQERAQALRLETKQPLRRVRVPRETALYGRDDQLEKLHAIFAKVKAGEGQVLLVEGEAGIGKTRLVDEFVGQLQQQGEDLNFLFGAYPPGGAATAAGAFSTAYREHFGKEGLAETLKEYLTETPLLIPSFAALLKGDATPTGAEPLTKESLQTVFVHATRGLAAERPTVVLLDDLHFAPEDGRALFAALAMALQEHPVLLVGTSRPGTAEDWVANLDRLGNFSRISLERLTPKELGRLVLDVFRSERLADELGFQIVMKSDGNPYFVFEIIRGLREGNLIAKTDEGTWVSTQVIKDIQIPSSVTDLIEARLADVSDEDREMLDVAACCGVEFDAALVADTLGLKRIPALRALGRVEKQHRLVRSKGPVFAFDHYQVQESLYNALSEPLRKEYHGALGDALEERLGGADTDPTEIDGSTLVQLCEHFLKSNEAIRAVRYLDAAFEYLEQGYLHDQAIHLANRALAQPGLLRGEDRAEVLLRLNLPLSALARRERQEEVLDEATRLADDSGDPGLKGRSRSALGQLFNMTSRASEAEVARREAIALFQESGDDKSKLSVARDLGLQLIEAGRFDEASELLGEALDIARACEDAKSEGSVESVLSTLEWRRGRLDAAAAHCKRAIEIARDEEDRKASSGVFNTLANICLQQGRLDESRSHFGQALERVREIGDRIGEARFTGNLANVSNSEGRTRDALAGYERSITMTRELADRYAEGVNLHNSGNVLRRLGAVDRAREREERSLELAREVEFPLLEAVSLAELAGLDEAAGKDGEAARHHEQAVEKFEELGIRDGHAAHTYIEYGAMLVRLDKSEEAIPLFERAIAISRDAGEPGPGVLGLLHQIRIGEIELDNAWRVFAEAEADLTHETKLKGRWLLWEATSDREHLDAAHELLEFLVEHAPDEHKETTLTNVPLHRDIMEAWNAQHV